MRHIEISLSLVAMFGCRAKGDLVGSFSCEEERECPDGMVCVSGRCEREGGDVDAAPAMPACATVEQLATTFATFPNTWAFQFSDGGGTAMLANGDLVLALPAAQPTARAGIGSSGTRDLRGHAITLEVPAIAGNVSEVSLTDNSGGRAFFGVREGTSMFVYMDGGFVIQRPYDPVADRWWRVREAQGTLHYDTSPDGATWSPLGMRPATIATEFLDVGFAADNQGTMKGGTARVASLNEGLDAAQPFCKIETLRDTFLDGRAGPLWVSRPEGACIVDEGQGTLRFTVKDPGTACVYLSTRPFDLRESTFATQVAPAPAPGITRFKMIDYAQRNVVLMERGMSGLRLIVVGAGSPLFDSTVPYDPFEHRYWRMSLDATRRIHFETSRDGTAFTEIGTASVPSLDASALVAELSLGVTVMAQNPITATFEAFE